MIFPNAIKPAIVSFTIILMLSSCICGIELQKKIVYNQTGASEEQYSLPDNLSELILESLVQDPPSGNETAPQVEGYCYNNETKKLECCENYKKRNINGKDYCLPICQPKCRNSICVKPGVCECFPDHVRSLAGDCVPTCPIGCINGKCDFHGVCTCNEGFIHDERNGFCVPKCDSPCNTHLFKNCTAPGTCECIKGYEMIEDICRPICKEPGCGQFGSCVAPDTCLCIEGYVFEHNTCMCLSNCGIGGFCIPDGSCGCKEGFELRDNTCVWKCDDCTNGICKNFNECICNWGYVRIDNKCVHDGEEHCREKKCVEQH